MTTQLNNLQKLIKLRGLTIQGISREIGQGYHITQKVIKGTRYKRSDGSYGVYSSRPVEEGVAKVLGLEYDQVWGERADLFLLRLIKQEIKQQAELRHRAMQEQWLTTDTLLNNGSTGNV